jgi:hypothetical protein
MLLKVGLLFLNNSKGMKKIVSSNEEENNATYYTLQKIEEEEDIPTNRCQILCKCNS